MNIFIDESGTFGWRNPGVSLFCGVIVPSRATEALYERFCHWRQTIAGQSKRELKGSGMTDAQLSSFASWVMPETERDIWLSCRGIDTSITKENIVLQLRDQGAIILDECSQIAIRHDNARLGEQYRQMSGWFSKRSTQNVVWLIGAADGILDSITASIVRFLEPEDDLEFEEISITLDQSFIRRDQHHDFWREWLRAEITKNSRIGSIPNIKEWRERNHPFYRKTVFYPNVLSFRSIVHEDMHFADSKAILGLQIADICANILLRHHRQSGGENAYLQLRRRIVARDGADIRLTHLNETSLHKDDPRLHAGVLDVEELKRMADALGSDRS